jgi:glycerophosphoryl diester phosphodiesterase
MRRLTVALALTVVLGLPAFLPIIAVSQESGVAPTQGNPFRTGRTLVIPHAGGDGLFPENTIVAFERSLALGGDVVDIDIQLSKDGIPMAFHDPTLDRTTNATGRVDAKTAAQLGRLDAGWKFNKDGKFPFRGKGNTIPKLADVLRRFPDRLTTLDLKDQRVDVVGPICTILRTLRRTQDVYVGIDTDEQVQEFRKKCPEVRTSGTSDERREMRAARERGETNFVTRQLVSQPKFLADDGSKRVTAESLAFSHSLNIAVLTYVVDDPKLLRELIELGVDGVYTRRPDVMVKGTGRVCASVTSFGNERR